MTLAEVPWVLQDCLHLEEVCKSNFFESSVNQDVPINWRWKIMGIHRGRCYDSLSHLRPFCSRTGQGLGASCLQE